MLITLLIPCLQIVNNFGLKEFDTCYSQYLTENFLLIYRDIN